MNQTGRPHGSASSQTTHHSDHRSGLRTRVTAGAGAVLLLAGGGAVVLANGGVAQAAPAGQAGRLGSLRLVITDGAGRPYTGDANQAFTPSSFTWSATRALPAPGRSSAPKYDSFTFTHAVGPGSIDLLTAMSRNVTMRSVTLEISQNDGAGRQGAYFKYVLSRAKVIGVEQESPESQADADAVRVPPQETVTISYESVSMESSPPGRGATTWRSLGPGEIT